MQLKKDTILSYIEEKLIDSYNSNKGFTTQEISVALNVQRTNVSAILNNLVKENKLVKTKGKPVRYFLSGNYQDVNNVESFDKLIGNNSSLKNAIRLAKAAIMYPDEKVCVLLKGEIGTGKEYFAHLMYEYAKEKKLLSEDGKFTVFDVSYYVDSPKEFEIDFYGDAGALETSVGGMLFVKHAELLDGNQIKRLFDVLDNMDKEVFVACGAEQKLSKFSANLLDSKFTIKIELPEIASRTFEERIELVEKFFMDEAENVNKNIRINSELLRCLLLYPLDQNIKQLQSDIRFACANAYVREINSKDTTLRVYLNDCPQYVRKGFIFYKKHSVEIESLIPENYTYTFNSNRSKDTYESYRVASSKSIYDVINKKAKELRNRNIKEEDILTILSADLESDLSNVNNTLGVSIQDVEALKKLVNPYIVNLVDDFLKEASNVLHRVFSIQVLCAISLDIFKRIDNQKTSKIISDEKIVSVIENYRMEYSLAQKFVKKIEKEFDVNLPIDETILITVLISGNSLQKNKREPVTLVVMHGNIASSIANTVNGIYKSKKAYAYDLLLDKPLEDAYDELKSYINSLDTGGGFLIIFDMGSIKKMCESIVNELNIKARMIEFPITAFALDAVIRISSGESVDSVYENIINQGFGTFSTLSKEYKRIEKGVGRMIVAFCRTGEGSAKQIKSYIKKHVHLDDDTEVISIAVKDATKLLEEVNKIKRDNRVVTVVGTFDPKLHDVPYISIATLFKTEPEKLPVLLSLKECKETEDFGYGLMYDYLEEQLTNVSIKKLKRVLLPAINKIKKMVDNFTVNEEVGLFMHISCLISHLIAKEETPLNLRKDTIISRHKCLYNQLAELLVDVEEEFGVKFSYDDIATIIEIIS